LKPHGFDYIKASSVEHALDLLTQGDDVKLIAGGQSLLPTLNMRLSAPSLLVDINQLDEMRGIELTGEFLRIGALTRHAELQGSDLVATHTPLLTLAIVHVAHAAIRNRGTIGGNLALADPASELPACAVALDARINIVGQSGTRSTPAREYFKDLYETDLQADELLASIDFPVGSDATACAFREHVRRRGDFATTGLVVNAVRQGSGFGSIAAVFFAVANTPVMVHDTVANLIGSALCDDDIARAQQTLEGELEVFGDAYASETMKMHLAKHYLKESLEELRG
jgi:carbon-monoxide dehydrogenase medium subunit